MLPSRINPLAQALQKSREANEEKKFLRPRVKKPPKIQPEFEPLKREEFQQAPVLVNRGELTLDLPQIKDEDLPCVSLITITKDRPEFLPLMIHNFQTTHYPAEKLEWVILDDSAVPLLGLPSDERIKYHHIEPSNVGEKRNRAVELASHQILVHLDDDDYYFPEHVLAKVRLFKAFPQVGCLIAGDLGIYDLKANLSFITNDFTDFSENSMAYRRSFWETKRFGPAIPFRMYEGYQMVAGREKETMIMPFWFNLVAITHGRNYTGRLRTLKPERGRSYPSFFRLVFPPEVRAILVKIRARGFRRNRR